MAHVLRVILLLAGLLAGGTGRADAREILPGPVPAVVVAVIDGDSLKVRARIWLGVETEIIARLEGIDAPELNGRCPAERDQARLARQRLADLAPVASAVTLREIQGDKYGNRVLARVRDSDGRDLAAALLAAGLARPYAGRGARPPWCAGSD